MNDRERCSNLIFNLIYEEIHETNIGFFFGLIDFGFLLLSTHFGAPWARCPGLWTPINQVIHPSFERQISLIHLIFAPVLIEESIPPASIGSWIRFFVIVRSEDCYSRLDTESRNNRAIGFQIQNLAIPRFSITVCEELYELGWETDETVLHRMVSIYIRSDELQQLTAFLHEIIFREHDLP